MTTMNRLYDFNSKSCLKAQLYERELGLDFMRSSIDKHKREHCVLDTTLQM